jgi:DNA-binding winged helix-turn-helix (wHTH) protein
MVGLNLFEFGEFALDLSERKLSRNGDVSPLAPKAFDLLAVLVRRAGRLVTKRELLDQVWPEAFVEEGILSVHIAALRKALGDSGRRGRCIETVPGSGYRFTATVRPPADSISARPGTSWSLAVLPPQGSAAADSHVPDAATSLAIADALIDHLGRIDTLVVRPTRAVGAFSGPDPDARAIGRSLQVDAVLQSRLVRTDRAVVASFRLVRSRDGACIWRGTFEEAPGNVAAIPSAVAESLAAHLGLAGRWTSLGHTQSADVFELFGRGRGFLLSGSMFEVPKAVEAFGLATALDPGYAAAHAGLALAWCAQAELRLAPPATAYAEARSAALRALAMDAECADAQAALGAVASSTTPSPLADTGRSTEPRSDGAFSRSCAVDPLRLPY